MDPVFKALADPTRRRLLDRLREDSGQTLGKLCADLGMARQSATQHLAILEGANLISVVWRGREKLHYLNPVPIHEIQRRWIAAFERSRLDILSDVKIGAEEGRMAVPNYIYITYINAAPEQVWEALTDADLTGEYWGHRNVSDWQPGSRWEHQRTDGSGIADTSGVVVEATPPTWLVMTMEDSTVTFTIERYQEIVRVTVVHENLATEADHEAVARGWPAVLANLKTLLETGHILPQEPWTMP
jgi:DNA-binding transcriptional ArsR family regulator